jgi:hypothetical protein
MRYTYECLEPLLIPYFKEILIQIHEPDLFNSEIKEQIRYIFMYNGAPSHKWTQCFLAKQGIFILKHISNSSDINALEQA